MTVKIPSPSFADKVLNALGKKRDVIIPSDSYEKFGQSSHSVVKKENFIKALFRPSNQALPNGMVDIHSFILNQENIVNAVDSEE